MFATTIEISEALLEPGYRHVNHCDALRLLEQARLQWLETRGVANGGLIAQGLFLVVTEVRARYLRELFAGPVQVTCGAALASGKRFHVDQQILNEKGKVAVDATIEFAVMDGGSKRAISVPLWLLEALKGEDR